MTDLYEIWKSKIKVTTLTHIKVKTRTVLYWSAMILLIFFLSFLSGTFMIHRTAGKGGDYFFNSSLALPPASQTQWQSRFETIFWFWNQNTQEREWIILFFFVIHFLIISLYFYIISLHELNPYYPHFKFFSKNLRFGDFLSVDNYFTSKIRKNMFLWSQDQNTKCQFQV